MHTQCLRCCRKPLWVAPIEWLIRHVFSKGKSPNDSAAAIEHARHHCFECGGIILTDARKLRAT